MSLVYDMEDVNFLKIMLKYMEVAVLLRRAADLHFVKVSRLLVVNGVGEGERGVLGNRKKPRVSEKNRDNSEHCKKKKTDLLKFVWWDDGPPPNSGVRPASYTHPPSSHLDITQSNPKKGVFKNLNLPNFSEKNSGKILQSNTCIMCVVIPVCKLELFGICVNIYFALKALQTYTDAF
jgi:hypothetical protein